ncbi:baculoviral IAP repeat-containing protein 6 isoform X3 [Orussus abietinus]|uniref:baculoviral IAP repeat-containing protein 6 isoform X3 n=1 Tax=Orussus abietinus TaxID=222816 RepID=UPI000C71617A|nr:baculoviral IAP repeat-containing protein 6 isoform X3 [Orussus abietinus]
MSKMADDDPWLLKEDGFLNIETECKSIIYHPNLNVVLITTGNAQVYVFDVNSGVILQRCCFSGKADGKLQGVYLADGTDKILYTDGRAIGVRSDYNGVLLLDTILQTPVSRGEDIIKLELLLSEAILLHQCLRCIELPGIDHVQEVLQELSGKILMAQANQKKGIKAQKWNTVCLELPHGTLKLVCSGLVVELKKRNRYISALPIASAINERLNGLLPSLALEGGPADRELMFSEAARRYTFSKWPHMNYKWALPDQMAQAGFYHQPNSTGDDRAMCFTCNVCLVCWEPTDEPWSEHERHSPACPFVKGEYTQNVPLSVTLATAPARQSEDIVDVISTTNVSGLVATASHSGFVNVWNISNQFKQETSFYVSFCEQEGNNKECIQFYARNPTTSYLPSLCPETDPLSDYKPSSSHKLQLTALSIVGSSNSRKKEVNGTCSVLLNPIEPAENKVRPCLVCGVSIGVSNQVQVRTLENVWAASTDLAPSSSLVRAMNSANSAASDTLDIMKVADRGSSTLSQHLVLYDFHHKSVSTHPVKEDSTKQTKSKKTLSGTGTSASSNVGRQENMYQELFLGQFWYEVPVIEDLDSEMVVGTHFNGVYPTTTVTASSSNGIFSTPIGITVPYSSNPFDANFNPINSSEQFASTSEVSGLNKKTFDIMKGSKSEPVAVQVVGIDAPDYLRIAYVTPLKDGKHLYVALCPTSDTDFNDPSTFSNTNRMDVDEESELFPPKSYVYWDQNETQSGKLINGDARHCACTGNAILLVYLLDFSGKVVKLVPQPIVRRELPEDQMPVEHVLLPLHEKNKVSYASTASTVAAPTGTTDVQKPCGQVALVCKDGVVRLLDLSTLKTVREARLDGRKFISAAYCTSLERLCVCTNDGVLHFFTTMEEDESVEEKEDADDINMISEASRSGNESTAPSTSTSLATYQEQIIAHKSNLTYSDLRTLYELTRFGRHSPAYSATVPPCWSEMMQAQRQRRHPQHLHQLEYQHHTRTWRLQNDATTWDEHVFELTLPRDAPGSVGHVDVRFSLHSPCSELPTIQVTLLKQNITGIGHHKSPLTPVDEKIDFSLGIEQRGDNPVVTEEYQRQHNTEVLCGPINLQCCTDLSDHSGCVSLTSPKLFRTKARTLLVHIKASMDSLKDSALARCRVSAFDSKPPTSKKLRIDEAGPFLPGATVERLAASANKKFEYYIGCDWIHEISITVRSLHCTNIPNERSQRCAMLESKTCIENLLNIACLQTADKSPVIQSLALDILIWIAAIRLTRLRTSENSVDSKRKQLEVIRCVQGRLSNLLRSGLLYAGSSIAHKCVKLIILCSEGLHNSDDSSPYSFDEAVLAVLVTLLPSIWGVQWAGSLHWLSILITRLLPLDRSHSIAQQCVTLVQQIASEMLSRVNPYHLLLATRFGLYSSPFETELFDLEPPMPPKFSSIPLTYASIAAGDQIGASVTSNSALYPQDSIDLRDLLTLPACATTELVVPGKLKVLCANHNMKGLLEVMVEPLHFTCHAASDGTKMEKIDPAMNTVNIGTTLFDSATIKNSNATDIKVLHHVYGEDATFPWDRLLCWPSQQVLVVERMHSGARRFVILDFGSPVLLTDLMVPSCSDLVSLSIDIWAKSEESDGTRLIVAGDIGSKPLVVSDLQPPPVCRYLKITTIGRYGMSTTRCKIPLGMFYGHMIILPGETYSESTNSQPKFDGINDSSLEDAVESQCTILSTLAEDVQCRFSLATERLKSLLDPLLSTETSNVMHMQHFLHRGKISSENKEHSSSKILATYHECIMFQHQLNVVRSVWRRLEGRNGSQSIPKTLLLNVPSDKLRVLGETMLDILLYAVYIIGPVPSIPLSLSEVFTPSTCERFFHSICVVTPAPRLQLYAVATLARMAGHQPWWGDFLANMLVNLYSASSTCIFPQDRVFILLTFLGRKSLIAGPNKSSVVDAMVRTLGKLLAPLSNGHTSSSNRLDTTLIGWVLLFLSVCLDTTATHSSCIEESHEKNREQGFSSRWEFIQGESAMQRKFMSASRSSASRNYHRKIQKRLMHHKQHLQDLEQAKKAFQASSQVQAWSALSSQTATLSNKLEAALKSQERLFKKSLKHHTVKYTHDFHCVRRNDVSRNSRLPLQPTPRSDGTDVDIDCLTNLLYQHVLPVARGLIALILNNASNVDMFLLACKVVARLVVSTRPAISLGELMTEEQLLRLVRLATGTSDAAWSSHAISCLLQDLLEGGRLFPRPSVPPEESPSEESFESFVSEDSRVVEEDPVAGTSSSAAALGAEKGDGEVDCDEDTQDSAAMTLGTVSKSNGFNLPSLLESDDSDLEDFYDDILERGRNLLKKGNTATKLPASATSNSISLAMDARLEYGIEAGVEISLRRLSTLGAYNLPISIIATVHAPAEPIRPSQSTSRNSSWSDNSSDAWNPINPLPSNLSMLTRCFDGIFTDLYLQASGTSLELVLQLWLTLNLDAASGFSNCAAQFDPSITPDIPFNSAALSGLVSALSWYPGVSLRAWYLALQCLTLASNQPTQTVPEHADVATDGLLGGMASCIVKDRSIGPMLLRFLSGNGLNVEATDKQYIMAGPTVCQALQDFLVRLEIRCDVRTPSSPLGNALKDLLLWVLYQLVQPGGALVGRRGPLDAQCKLITSLINLNFTNADLGTVMSISECVGVLVATYIGRSGVGVQCGGAGDPTPQSGSFGGLYASVFGGDARHGRPASWNTLVVALIKLVCRLVQTPLPNSRCSQSEGATEMEIGDEALRPGASSNGCQTSIDTSQTDECKVAEQQTCLRPQQTGLNVPHVPCVADTVLQHEPTMMRLLAALGHSSGSSLAMLLGEGPGTGAATELGDPASVPDATFQLLSTLAQKASSPMLVLNPLYRYLASTRGLDGSSRRVNVMQLSEPLLWYILKVLDNEASLAVFTAMGGVRVLCENLVRSNSSGCGTGPVTAGVIALVMQHLSNVPTATPVVSASSKKTTNNLESYEDGLMNFAPLGTISWLNPTAQPADVLIQSAAPHRRARTAAWTYHFYQDEAWVDLTIMLPCAVLLREVELQPHLTSLSTCPSAVALEISRECNTAMMPICPPMPTAGLTFIRITLSKPEIATAVLVRLYKPRDSTSIGLSQIRLLGTTAFGEIKTNNDTIDEEQLTKTSLGWLRLIHQCLSVSTLNGNLMEDVLNSAASVEGLVDACCNLLLLPAPSLFTSNLERVLLQLGLHSEELGLRLINFLLDNRSTHAFQVPGMNQETLTVQLVVELLQQLCTARNSSTEARMSAVLSWLYGSARNATAHTPGTANFVSPPAVYIHCISAIVWKVHNQEGLSYDLQALLSDDIFNALYRWTLILEAHSALKQSIDAALCAFSYVRPSLFPLLLQRVHLLMPNLAPGHSASISDDRKGTEGQTDDKKTEFDAAEGHCRPVFLEYQKLHLTEGQLLTVAAAASSSSGVQQLIDSKLPAFLVALITEFCDTEKSKLQQQQRSTSNETCHGINSRGTASMTDNDKAEEFTRQSSNYFGNQCATEPESIAMVLEFLSLVCSEGRMRDWLGNEGRGFWLPLLTLLSNRPIENPSVTSRCSRRIESYTSLENATIKFLARCCWCHPVNQKLLAELLTDVISQQRIPPNVRYLHGISGFTRRLILQLLLEGEKVLIAVTSDVPMKPTDNGASQCTPSMPPHPAHPNGHYHKLLYMSTQSTVADILQQISGTWLLMLLPSSRKGSEANKSSSNRSRELWESGMASVVDTLSVAAGNTAKDKRAKEASNRSQARGPILRRPRTSIDGVGTTSKSHSSGMQANSTNSKAQQYLIHASKPNTPLPPQLTIAQLLAITEDAGVSPSEPCVYLFLRQRNKDSKEEPARSNGSELLNYRSIECSLGVFSTGGGLAVLARHLPLICPDSGKPSPVVEKSPSTSQLDTGWVKVEASDDVYEDVEEAGVAGVSKTSPPAPHVPPHSLTAFGLFLRLPGYAEVLLQDRKRAQCLLRLALGVSDDGEGRDMLSSPFAASLPTLPFQVLKQLLDATPPTTDDGYLLRRISIEVGAVSLLLDCLAIFTHQTEYNEGTEQRNGHGGGRSDDKSHLYWAKGTGFGTGSTQQSWNVEQSLLRQRFEEEHVTVLLQVLASYVGPEGQPQPDLPAPFTDLLSRSCLLPALSSYLRNDSVLDMARHIPLYRTILQLLRVMALSTQLAPLLLPRGSISSDPSVISLLSNMRDCVDTYMNKVNRTRGNNFKSIAKGADDSEQDEGLATLIPDIQESAIIVQGATAKLAGLGEESTRPSSAAPELPLRSIEQRYLEVMKTLQFDTYEMITENSEGGGYKFVVSYHFESNMRAAGERSHPTRVKRLAQEAVTLSSALPLSYSSSVFVRCDADRLDVMKVLITGPAETPYANGCFEFDVYFPPDYPNSPMLINLETTGRHTVRFNPNLYNDGKVCLSVLNTWHGRPEEKWNAHTSSFLQVLVSIQSLILVSEPYFNEPGYERSRGTSSGAQSSQEYNANICQATAKWAMLDQIRNPCPCFKEVIHTHFWLKRHEIVAQLEGWIRDMELHGTDRRSARAISLNALALRRHYKLLREELNKLPTPEGLEDLAEPLPSPGSPLELCGTSGTTPTTSAHGQVVLATSVGTISMPSIPSTTSVSSITLSNAGSPITNASASSHVHHDIDTDVEMEKMVSKVCE